MASGRPVHPHLKACATSLSLLPGLQAEYRNRAAALGNAIAALDVNAQPGNLATELRELQEQHARLQRQLNEEKTRADTLAAALRNALERLGPAAAEIEAKAARSFFPGA
jgi:predicted  nucleic acid-binding Zn-ribbon protein